MGAVEHGYSPHHIDLLRKVSLMLQQANLHPVDVLAYNHVHCALDYASQDGTNVDMQTAIDCRAAYLNEDKVEAKEIADAMYAIARAVGHDVVQPD